MVEPDAEATVRELQACALRLSTADPVSLRERRVRHVACGLGWADRTGVS